MLDSIEDLMRLSSNRFEALGGDREGQYSIRINNQWRLCFKFREGDASMSRLPITTEGSPMVNLPPIHPGEILAEELDELHLTPDTLARELDVPVAWLLDILNGERGITAEAALRLSRYFGTSARFWMNLQQSYDLAVAERDHGEMIGKGVQPRVA